MQCNYEKTCIFAFKTTGYRGPLNAREEHYCFENHFMSFVSTCHDSDAQDLKKIPTFLDKVSIGHCWDARDIVKLQIVFIIETQRKWDSTGENRLTEYRTRWKPACPTVLPLGNVSDRTSLFLLHPPKRASMLLLLAYQYHSLRPVLKRYWRKEFPQHYLNDFQWK